MEGASNFLVLEVITYIKARMAADNGPGRTVATETTNEAAREPGRTARGPRGE